MLPKMPSFQQQQKSQHKKKKKKNKTKKTGKPDLYMEKKIRQQKLPVNKTRCLDLTKTSK